jgi:hypothetical protein
VVILDQQIIVENHKLPLMNNYEKLKKIFVVFKLNINEFFKYYTNISLHPNLEQFARKNVHLVIIIV